eukprot:2677754-Prymnesium_polylepis.1
MLVPRATSWRHTDSLTSRLATARPCYALAPSSRCSLALAVASAASLAAEATAVTAPEAEAAS